MGDNRNVIVMKVFSSAASERMYDENWPEDVFSRELYDEGVQCGGCSFFAKFDFDWGLCAHPKSRHHSETVFEHFTCPAHVNEGVGTAQFSRTVRTSLPVRQWAFPVATELSRLEYL